MEYCEKCKENTYHKQIRSFPTPTGRRVWVSCEKCNNIKVRVVK
jgi:hypothetical protein